MKVLKVLLLATLALLSSIPGTIDGAKILALLNVASPSHFIFNKVLVRTLATRGHQVTVLTPDIDKDSAISNLKYIHIEGVYENLTETFDYENLSRESYIEMLYEMLDWAKYCCEKSFQSKGIQEFIKSHSTDKFDLIITEAAFGECFLGFIPFFGYPPVVAISAYGVVPTTGMMMGTPYNPAYQSNTLLGFSKENTILERLKNFISHNIYVYLYIYKGFVIQEEIAKKYLKQDMPSIAEIQSNFSIFLTNSVFGFDESIPLSPNIIPVGGLHIKTKPDPLPKDLQKFLDEAKDGFIFFSLGSNLRSNMLPKEKRQAILDALSELSQRVLWKFESDNLERLPPNVKIGKWFPQSDILAHQNIRLFISHCGKMSSVESTYRGVPILGIPFFADQHFNVDMLVSKGAATKVDYSTLTKNSLLNGIREILNNNSYRDNMKKLSEIYKGHPISALDNAIFWTEYVIKHGGAPHLRPASTALNLYQFLLLDVIFILVSGTLVFSVLIYYLIKKIYNMITRKTQIKKKTH